ncbi:TPA: iron-containing alcohol dehydrogenase [Clostridium perfringens]|uniref:Iron-containing alcohol dehydrogenase n=1 Tax=Clostridium perfringens TaxID=1502 RepID=A0A133NCG5_CLOPF|nr:iron-containing alcohol dehydrogenase [Clostridium perfringens]EGT3603346.1 iron-containing alcohol dehydrogenase [Clostridium perfringens]EHA6439759.1 iron-containing alcohol dehydrogenase [Clostridium perfringens]EHK2399188.1 iron-containing alcohol dehydrogenase [Clostridium perfringens]EJT5918249.1 iron-containing alcohol dehydrogenase [Clostridium perfringens]EJT5926601.1 iron-containing alcohol dehydrogenase [Clostridium perfringens]
MQRFTIPRDLYFGEDAVDHLKSVKGSKALIVIGSERLIKDGTVPKVQANLKEANIETRVFTGVENDPSVATVRKGVEMMNEFNPDLIIGIGGGSPIDAAKAMWIFYEYPEFTFEEAAKPFNLPELRQKAKFIAIPTTSGTATEVTSFSVITDNETGVKYPIADYNITPDVAIVDTNLVQTMPKNLVANTGMDALTHAFEAYVSTARNPITDALAMKSIEMIVANLYDSFEGKEQARKDMHIAQNLAGMAFSNAILGIVHSMAHKTGKIFDVPHGLANAIYLPAVVQFNAKTAMAAYADIASRLGLEGNNEEELVASLVNLVKDLRNKMGMANSLKEFGISEEMFRENLDAIAETAVADPCTGTNPREISVEEMKKLFEAVYYGEDVNF